MKFLRNILKNMLLKKEAPDDHLKLARVIGPQIDKLANDIFYIYSKSDTLRSEKYIIQAVWNDRKNGPLERVQCDISNIVESAIISVFNELSLNQLDASQRFAIEYMIKGLIITKVIYMIEVLRNRMTSSIRDFKGLSESLETIEPIGSA